MDANQRSESNNQTNNGANEKDRQGASQQRAGSGSGMAHPHVDRPEDHPLASTGAAQGNTDSHQRQMEMHSDAWGKLEQPVGERKNAQGTSVDERGRHEGVVSNTGSNVTRGTEAGVPGVQQGDIYGNRQGAGAIDENRADTQDASASRIQQSVDRHASQTGEDRRETAPDDIHKSNNVSGGLPRSPGNSGPRNENPGWQPGGSMQADPDRVHESNDAAGGYPRSPAGANKLAGDRKMDDDTGFSRG